MRNKRIFTTHIDTLKYFGGSDRHFGLVYVTISVSFHQLLYTKIMKMNKFDEYD